MTERDASSSDRKARNKAIGERLQYARTHPGGRKTTQAALADAMRSRGHLWSADTVYQIESGSQPIRALEIADAAEILGVPVDAILNHQRGEMVLAVHVMLREFEYHSRHLESAVKEFEGYRLRLAGILDRLSDADRADGDRAVRGARRIVAKPSWVLAEDIAGEIDAIGEISGRLVPDDGKTGTASYVPEDANETRRVIADLIAAHERLVEILRAARDADNTTTDGEETGHGGER